MRRVDFTERPKCLTCDAPAQKGKKRKDGTHGYNPYCSHCYHGSRPHRLHKKNQCEKCGFVAVHRCQLDVDHIDGDHSNNDASNLQTLCRNCHSLKTQLNGDYIPKKDSDANLS
jgi:hypothetical protein